MTSTLAVVRSAAACLLLALGATTAAAQPAPEPPAVEESGPPPSALEPTEETRDWSDVQGDEEDSEYSGKDDGLYFDLYAAQGVADSNALTLNISFFNFYEYDEGDTVGLHARFMAIGLVTYRHRELSADGTADMKREYAVSLELLSMSTRFYFDGPVFMSLAMILGATIDERFLPVFEPQAGLGFHVGGWGVEIGVRLSRLPRRSTVIDGNEFLDTEPGAAMYTTIETDWNTL